MTDFLFIFICAVTVLSAAFVVFSRNLIRSAFMLLFTLGATAGIYAMLGSDFLAVIQLLVYVGGILVVVLFAIMLTQEISREKITNPSRKDVIAVIISVSALIFTLIVIFTGPAMSDHRPQMPVTGEIGELLLTEQILSFELISFLLLAGLVGSVYIVRYSFREEKNSKKENEL